MSRALVLGLALACAGMSARAEDCARLAPFPDRLICSDTGLSVIDAAMNGAYTALRDRTDAPGRQRLLAAQRYWLTLRDRQCRGTPDDPAAQQIACLKEQTEARRAALAAGRGDPETDAASAPTTAPGGGPELRVAYYRRRNPQGRCVITARYPVLPDGHRAAAAFAAAMRAAAAGREGAACPARPGSQVAFDYDASYDVTLRTARLVAVTFASEINGRAAHPITHSESVIFDLARGRAVALGDLVDVARAVPAIGDACQRQLADDLRQRGEAPRDGFAARIRRAAGDARAWTLEPAQLRIGFDRESIADYVAGDLECAVPMATLQPFLRPDSPLR